MDWGFSGKSYALGIFRFETFRSERNRGVTVNSWVVKNWEYVWAAASPLLNKFRASAGPLDLYGRGSACSPEGLPMEFGILSFRFHGEHVGLF